MIFNCEQEFRHAITGRTTNLWKVLQVTSSTVETINLVTNGQQKSGLINKVAIVKGSFKKND